MQTPTASWTDWRSKARWAPLVAKQAVGLALAPRRGEAARIWSWRRWRAQSRFFRRFGIPEDIFRNYEYNYAEWALRPRAGQRIADIGTGRTLFAAYMATRYRLHITAIDIDRYGEEYQREFMRKVGYEDFELHFADATATGLPDASFDGMLAVSTIEHFPGDGDTRFVREAARLLRPGGRLVVTVPCSPTFAENENVVHYHGFERRYTRETLRTRLFEASSDFAVENEAYINERLGTPLVRAIEGRHGILGQFFGVWYAQENNLKYSRHSVWLTRALLELGDVPDAASTCGAMFTLVRRT